MADLEKVLKGLSELHAVSSSKNEVWVHISMKEFNELMGGALELLKAQEPILCGEKIKAGDVMLDFYECGYCKNAIRKPWKYCPFCGKAVKWDG